MAWSAGQHNFWLVFNLFACISLSVGIGAAPSALRWSWSFWYLVFIVALNALQVIARGWRDA